jgi:alkaline phosphatase
VLVTADHETGNLYLENGVYTFHSHEHTSKNVPVFVYGCDDLFAPGEAVDNYTIPIRLAEKLGWSSEEFPTKDPGRFMRLFKKITSIPALTAA